ncbi:MAG TPA: ankyrin repeat domain-containing protein, partial [Gemmataceae bacterium]|nr:ankyrin repeat domain-containing protein [Gemmataceae bacterium]
GDVEGFRRWLKVLRKEGIREPSLSELMEYAIEEDRPEIVDMLVEYGAGAEKGFLAAVENGRLEIARALLPHAHLLRSTYRGSWWACEIARVVVIAGSALLRRTRGITKADLQDAFCSRGPWRDLELVELLIKAGADLNYRDGRGCTPLDYAEQFGEPKAVHWLLDRGANARARQQGQA